MVCEDTNHGEKDLVLAQFTWGFTNYARGCNVDSKRTPILLNTPPSEKVEKIIHHYYQDYDFFK